MGMRAVSVLMLVVFSMFMIVFIVLVMKLWFRTRGFATCLFRPVSMAFVCAMIVSGVSIDSNATH